MYPNNECPHLIQGLIGEYLFLIDGLSPLKVFSDQKSVGASPPSPLYPYFVYFVPFVVNPLPATQQLSISYPLRILRSFAAISPSVKSVVPPLRLLCILWLIPSLQLSISATQHLFSFVYFVLFAVPLPSVLSVNSVVNLFFAFFAIFCGY